MKKCVTTMILMTCSLSIINAQSPVSSTADRMASWKDTNFGMFIHWGVYSVPAGLYAGKQIPGIGEWIMNPAKIPGIKELTKVSNGGNKCFVNESSTAAFIRLVQVQ